MRVAHWRTRTARCCLTKDYSGEFVFFCAGRGEGMVTCELDLPTARPSSAKLRSEAPGLRALEALLDADPHLRSAQAILGPLRQTFSSAHVLLLKGRARPLAVRRRIG